MCEHDNHPYGCTTLRRAPESIVALTGVNDTFGVEVRVGDRVRIVHWGYAIRLTDTGREVTITGVTSHGNLTHDGGRDVANGRALRPGCVGVLDRSDRDNPGHAGYEGNRDLYRGAGA